MSQLTFPSAFPMRRRCRGAGRFGVPCVEQKTPFVVLQQNRRTRSRCGQSPVPVARFFQTELQQGLRPGHFDVFDAEGHDPQRPPGGRGRRQPGRAMSRRLLRRPRPGAGDADRDGAAAPAGSHGAPGPRRRARRGQARRRQLDHRGNASVRSSWASHRLTRRLKPREESPLISWSH